MAGAERFELSTRGFGGNVETVQSVGMKGIAPFFFGDFVYRFNAYIQQIIWLLGIVSGVPPFVPLMLRNRARPKLMLF